MFREPYQLFDLLLPPENPTIEQFSAAKVVLFNEFAKTVNVTFDDISFTAKMIRKRMLEIKDIMQSRKELPVSLNHFLSAILPSFIFSFYIFFSAELALFPHMCF